TGAVEALDGLLVGGLEREMDATRQLASGGATVRGRDEQLVGPEEAGALAAERHAEGVEHGPIESPAPGQGAHPEMDVIDQAPAMDLHALTIVVTRPRTT